MDVLNILKQEDDNPTGLGSKFRGGNTLEEAGAAEAERQERKALRWSLTQQEAGIIHLMQAKNFFQRLRLPEPRKNEQGEPVWSCSDATLQRTYETAKMCCHPDWAHHPKRDHGYALLTEAMNTLTDRNGKRDEYIAQVAEEVAEREARLNAQWEAQNTKSTGTGRGPGVTERWEERFSSAAVAKEADAGAAEVAAELGAQMAARRAKMQQLEQASKLKRPAPGPSRPGPAPGNSLRNRPNDEASSTRCTLATSSAPPSSAACA